MLPVGDAELHVAVLAEVALQPDRFLGDLVQDPEHELLRGHRRREDADTLLVSDARVSPCSDEGITETCVPSNVGQKQCWGRKNV